MTGLFIGVYALYLIVVGVEGNASALLSSLQKDMHGYLPWLFAIIMIALLAQNETTEKMVKPFIALLILNFVLRNAKKIESQIKEIYSMNGAQ